MKTNSSNRSAGFSLVEVTIAMAIASVALVTLIGLLPQGMDTMRAAADQAIQGRIHQQILNEIQMASYDRLDSYHQMEVYYDAQGEELGDNKGGGGGTTVKGTFEHIYSARIAIPQMIGGSVPQSVGGASFAGVNLGNGLEVNEDLRLVIVEIAAVGGRGKNFDWSDPDNRSMIETYQSYVVKMGQDFTP